ncbi:copper resistance protein CopC [Cryptosporangium sp. NPDC048952]|uniref:copper resistance CopC family protein n=1 Tax=Cryptosporangium sp. NPDC048952 TaxID=3363961 RepID=UPI00371D5B35
MLGAQPAKAHSNLAGSSPKADSTVTAAPKQVTLTFGEVIRGNFSTVVVTGPDGVRYGDGKASAVDKTLSQPVKPLVAGKYTVAWRVVSADGHPIQGVFTFTADLPAAPSPSPTEPAPNVSEPAPSQSPAAATEPTDDGSSPLPWVIAGVAAVLALAGATLLARRRRTT